MLHNVFPFRLTTFISMMFFVNFAAAQQDDFKAVSISKSHEMDAKIFSSADPEAVKKYMPNGNVPASMSSFVLFAGDDVVLIDAGLGDPNWVNGLIDLNIKPEKVKLILLTHMHSDHIGGLLDGDVRRFPRAVILSAKLEYDYWLPKDSKPRTLPLEKIKAAYGNDFLKTFNFDDQVFANDFVKVKALDAVGHTPGHTAFLIESAKSRLLIVGDLLHAAALQFPLPEACSNYDMDPKATVTSRKRILDFAAKENIPIGGMHLPVPNIGTVKSNGHGGYDFTPKEK